MAEKVERYCLSCGRVPKFARRVESSRVRGKDLHYLLVKYGGVNVDSGFLCRNCCDTVKNLHVKSMKFYEKCQQTALRHADKKKHQSTLRENVVSVSNPNYSSQESPLTSPPKKQCIFYIPPKSCPVSSYIDFDLQMTPVLTDAPKNEKTENMLIPIQPINQSSPTATPLMEENITSIEHSYCLKQYYQPGDGQLSTIEDKNENATSVERYSLVTTVPDLNTGKTVDNSIVNSQKHSDVTRKECVPESSFAKENEARLSKCSSLHITETYPTVNDEESAMPKPTNLILNVHALQARDLVLEPKMSKISIQPHQQKTSILTKVLQEEESRLSENDTVRLLKMCQTKWCDLIAEEVLRISKLKTKIIQHLAKEIETTIDRLLCHRKNGFISELMKKSSDDLKSFQWNNLVSEMKQMFPSLYNFLLAMVLPCGKVGEEWCDTQTWQRVVPRLGLVYGILAQTRNRELNRVQRMVSLYFLGKSSTKKTIKTLKPVGLCLSYATSLKLADLLQTPENLIHEGPENLIHGGPENFIHEGPENLIHGGPENLIHGGPENLIHEGPENLIHGGPENLIHEGPENLIHGGPENLIHGGPENLIHEGPENLIHGGPENLIHEGLENLCMKMPF
ncbi:hypothetical protein CHS0354_008764 [Potamilus streckersoni]|uniref:ZAD domain-containing protein n=1 Tax=Potamilus streckersoni TaxID=2493646 RepID=A0AAE0SED9_9BIVA|nr:hypothetical protein CHS0354_008764 [Potamilus streckersoni]